MFDDVQGVVGLLEPLSSFALHSSQFLSHWYIFFLLFFPCREQVVENQTRKGFIEWTFSWFIDLLSFFACLLSLSVSLSVIEIGEGPVFALDLQVEGGVDGFGGLVEYLIEFWDL